MYWVKAKRGASPVKQAAKTAKAAVEVGDRWAGEGAAVTIETEDGGLFSLEQFKKNVVGAVRLGEA